MPIFAAIRYRLYQDFFMGSRLETYRTLLERLAALGYRFRTMAEFIEATARGEVCDAPVCLLRNDVDSDPRGAARMFACERDTGARATYYFRLSTLDPELANAIAAHGGEVGYHFEEIASAVKQLRLRNRAQIDARLPEIRERFRKNIAAFREESGIAPRTVAAHGDFANRRLGISNAYLLTRQLMDELGILADVYDPRIHSALAARFSDCPPPQWWRPADPITALAERPATVSILVHPRQWTCRPLLNLRLLAERVRDEAIWRWRGTVARGEERQPLIAVL